jgi:serine/threonine protein phosphatase PrpC
MLEAFGATHPGNIRRQNEDGMVLDVPLGLFAVADGMGGHNAGEVASRLALETLQIFLDRSKNDPDHTWPFGIDGKLDFNGNRLRTAVKLANRRVFRESESRDQYTGMGTTIVAVVIEASCAVLCGVGDSRIYIVRKGQIERLTRDHTWVQLVLAQNPGMDPEALQKHSMRHVLTNVIGAQDDVDVAVTSRPVLADDRIVLCTDGVHGPLEDLEIAKIVTRAVDVRSAAESLVAKALDIDGSDNLTALVVAAS